MFHELSPKTIEFYSKKSKLVQVVNLRHKQDKTKYKQLNIPVCRLLSEED